MPDGAIQATFDYTPLSTAAADELRASASRIKTALKQSLEIVGRELFAAKDRLDHGLFTQWVERELQMSARTAQLIMRAYEMIRENEKFSLLGRSALFILAAPDVPPATRDLVCRMIDDGQAPTYTDTKAIIKSAKLDEGCENSRVAREIAEHGHSPIVDLEERRLQIEGAAIEAETVDLSARVEATKQRLASEAALAAMARLLDDTLNYDKMTRLIGLCRKAHAEYSLLSLAQALEALSR